ncbi:MAG: nucleotidyltransferase domain-containing protein [Candidatus Woesearchaeota archaeon]|jgi:predicted nucleotidyltransferase|nr:nucleotidyltransferase domain-containing protein [Candidatus Woesearchaeota archaeon]
MVVILTLKKFLKNNKDARKIFGEKELKIVFKQLEGITLTQSEKNRLSRDVRPKLEFIREINEFRDEFKLKKDQDNKKMIDKAVELILEDELKDKVRAVLLFGSHSRGIVTPRSDVDVCVVFDNIERSESGRFRLRILSDLPDKFDIQTFNTLPQKIKRDIARNHKVLFKGNDFDNTDFTIQYLKDEDYFLRMKRIFGEAA